MVLPMYKEKPICVKTYWTEENFLEIIAAAEQAGIRRKGLSAFTQKKHGFKDERLANTDKIGAFLKHCYEYYMRSEPKRLEEIAHLLEEEKKIQERKKKLGLVENSRF